MNSNKKYESLYQRSKGQNKRRVFAYFLLKDGNESFDPWLPYRRLADLAQRENWQSYEYEEGFERRKFPDGNLEILSSYLNFTFMRLQEEGKILYSKDSGRACFNTGLLSRRYGKDIYAFFERNRNSSGGQDWFFKEFVTQSDAMRRKLLEGFAGFPPVAEYYNAENYRDLFFNLEYKTIIVAEHIVEDNVDRLPPKLRDDPNMAYSTIKGSTDKLYEKIRRNYKLAVPHWYGGRIQLLLPLYLMDADTQGPDLALVAERVDEQKCYVVKTILTMSMAYKDARIICRPNSDWLAVRNPQANRPAENEKETGRR